MTEPIYLDTLRAEAARHAVDTVRRGLRYCEFCHACAFLPCRTATGKPRRVDHVGRLG